LPERVDVGGLEVAYRRAGRGKPLLLLHGAFADSRSWRPQLETLSDEFDVVAWDAPGCGDRTCSAPVVRQRPRARALPSFPAAPAYSRTVDAG
jgi:pimeloyl-ACP methyl ester carboxylesterase